MSVPAGVLPYLVVVQSGLALRGLEGLLDRPAGSGHAHEFGQTDPPRGVAEVARQLGRPGRAAPGQQPVLGVGVTFPVDPRPRPRVLVDRRG